MIDSIRLRYVIAFWEPEYGADFKEVELRRVMFQGPEGNRASACIRAEDGVGRQGFRWAVMEIAR